MTAMPVKHGGKVSTAVSEKQQLDKKSRRDRAIYHDRASSRKRASTSQFNHLTENKVVGIMLSDHATLELAPSRAPQGLRQQASFSKLIGSGQIGEQFRMALHYFTLELDPEVWEHRRMM